MRTTGGCSSSLGREPRKGELLAYFDPVHREAFVGLRSACWSLGRLTFVWLRAKGYADGHVPLKSSGSCAVSSLFARFVRTRLAGSRLKSDRGTVKSGPVFEVPILSSYLPGWWRSGFSDKTKLRSKLRKLNRACTSKRANAYCVGEVPWGQAVQTNRFES